MRNNLIGIIGAMDIEVDALIASMENTEEKIISSVRFVKGEIFGRNVVIAKCGIGKVFAAICAQTMILEYNPTVIINTGVAGSLTPNLNIGDIVIANSVCQHDFDTSPLGDPKGLIPEVNLVKIPADEKIVAYLEKAVGTQNISYEVGTVASGDVFVADSEVKDGIVNGFGAYAAEMEGGSIGHVCYINQVPFAILRSISDSEGGAMDYQTFAEQAAEQSIEVVKEFIERV